MRTIDNKNDKFYLTDNKPRNIKQIKSLTSGVARFAEEVSPTLPATFPSISHHIYTLAVRSWEAYWRKIEKSVTIDEIAATNQSVSPEVFVSMRDVAHFRQFCTQNLCAFAR